MTQPSDEAGFLSTYDPQRYERLSVRVDVAIATLVDKQLHAVTYTRSRHPHLGTEALPGEFVGKDESLTACALRVLQQRIGIDDVYLEQLYTFGAPSRDPRMRVVSVAFYALVPPTALASLHPDVHLRRLVVPWQGEEAAAVGVAAGDGSALALAYDHDAMLGMLVSRLRGKLRYAPIAYALLGDTFTLRQLQDVHEGILGKKLNVPSFRRTVLRAEGLVETGERQTDVGHRPAMLYQRP